MVQSSGKKTLGGGQGGLPARTLSTLGSRAIITIYLRTQYNNYCGTICVSTVGTLLSTYGTLEQGLVLLSTRALGIPLI